MEKFRNKNTFQLASSSVVNLYYTKLAMRSAKKKKKERTVKVEDREMERKISTFASVVLSVKTQAMLLIISSFHYHRYPSFLALDLYYYYYYFEEKLMMNGTDYR